VSDQADGQDDQGRGYQQCPAPGQHRAGRTAALLAQSQVHETMLPVRYYLPREDIRAELSPSSTQTYCAYKGRASYWSVTVGGQAVPDIAWTYQEPLHDAAQVSGLTAFFGERVDMVVDGERYEPCRAACASRGTRMWVFGLPQPVTGSQPGPAR